MNRRALPVAAVLALVAAQLGGCVAAALVPLAAGGTLVKKTADGSKTARVVKPVVVVGTATATAAEPVAELAPVMQADVAQAAADPAAEAPASPTPALSADPLDGYGAMAEFVLAQAETAKPGKARRSALLDQRSLTALPRMLSCGDQRGALVIDLDPGDKAFDLNDPPSPAPGLAERLRAIRGTGTAVVWIASLPESRSKELATVLQATGLDPLGIDPFLLMRPRETRKQQVLNRAAEDWCVLAIAGDRKADFDEVFDYLRNPDGPVALALEQHLGAGWFVVPPPIR
ncbi:MAG: hypothetical protein RIS85_1011 [Pseudomonadota bacterium]